MVVSGEDWGVVGKKEERVGESGEERREWGRLGKKGRVGESGEERGNSGEEERGKRKREKWGRVTPTVYYFSVYLVCNALPW